MRAAASACRCASGCSQVDRRASGFRRPSRGRSSCWSDRPRSSTSRWRRRRVQESVTVTGEAPLVDTTQLDARRQHRSAADAGLPVNGRNWMDLTLLAPGSRAERVERRPSARPVSITSSSTSTASRSRTTVGTQLRPAALQPRRDRRVRVRHEPLRRDAGALERHAGQRHHQVGHQHAGRHVRGLLPRRQVQREGLRRRSACCRTRTSR